MKVCTYCGQDGHSAHECPIRKREAHALLDAARAGLPTPWHRITEALAITGDLASPWIERPVRGEEAHGLTGAGVAA